MVHRRGSGRVRAPRPVPVLRVSARTSATRPRSSRSRSSVTRPDRARRGTPAAATRMFSSTVREPKSSRRWKVRPRPSLARRWAGSWSMLRPCRLTCPPSGRRTPVMTLNSVVLPAPFGPIRPVTVPSAASMVTWSRAVCPPKRTVTSLTSSPTEHLHVGRGERCGEAEQFGGSGEPVGGGVTFCPGRGRVHGTGGDPGNTDEEDHHGGREGPPADDVGDGEGVGGHQCGEPDAEDAQGL